ncbi:MAG: potassium channel family protein [Sedimentibacter sp.]
MSLKYPKKASLGWASEIRNKHFILVLLVLFIYYLAINLIFSTAYYAFNALVDAAGFFDYVYFSFVTSLSIGYGDLVPVNVAGKIIVIIQACITAMYFALMISVLSIKLFYPRELIKFSEKIIYNPETDMLIIRVLNTNRDSLVNPDIRISVTEHNTGNKSAGMYNIPIDHRITYLGKYDFSYTFKNSHHFFNVMNEAKRALEYNKLNNSIKSRFRINVSITGSYGFNHIAIYKKYYAGDILNGRQFKPITYSKEFYSRKGGVKYNKIKGFWDDFEKVEGMDEH